MRTWKNILSLVMAVAMIFSMGAITAFADAAPNGVAPETVAFYGSENSPAISGTNGVALTSDIEIEFSSFTAVGNGGWGTGNCNWTVDGSDIATQTGLTITVDNDAKKVTISGQPTSSHNGWVYLSASNDSGSTGKIALYAVIQAGRDGYGIEINKTVVQGGTVTPPAETFEFEILDANGNALSGDVGFQWENDNSGSISNKISTNGANTYVGVLTFSTKEGTLVDLLGAGFRIREKAGSTANWTYDNTYYIVEENNGQTTITKVSGQSREIVTSIVFTNTYTKSNWAPNNPGRTDDDDDEVTTSQHDPSKFNPDTGAGTPMDYLTYLFHKYVLWFL